MHSKFLVLFLVSIYLPAFQCQIYGSSRCNGGPFNCGSVGYISYPFWGGDRQSYCGRPGFKLVCNDGVPMLNISSLSYKVLEIDFSSYTLKVARQDLANNLCPDILRNTTMDPALFEYQPEYKDNNVTLYFNCTSDDPDIPGQFNCSSGGTGDINLFRAGPRDGTTCEDQIYVPVNEVAAQKLRHPIVSSINQLRSALVEGFSIHWLSDGKELEAPLCNRNVYGSCVARARLPRTHCSYSALCRRSGDGGGSLVPSPSPAPEDGQVVEAAQSPGTGMPPEIAQAPGNSPESNGYQPPTGHAEKGVTDDAVGNKSVTEIIVVVLLGITGVVIVSTVICCSKRRRSASVSKQKMNQDIEDTLHGLMALKRYRYSEIKKITKSFKDKLGQGGYGSVYKGVLPDGCLVAVKVLIETDSNSNGEEFINEVVSISRTSHVNIVNLLGFCFDRNKRALVYEFMPNKSLDKFINDNCLNLEKLFKIAVGVAKGLEYLHTGCSTRIVHFDIKPQNILLDEDFCPKISDFGLAKLYKKKMSILSVLGTRGTIGYIAPEVFSRNYGGVSHKSDVYSYGMMVLEMAGAKKFGDTDAIESSDNYFPDKIYEHVLDSSKKLDESSMIEEEEEIARKMFFVGFWCIQTNPSDRPSMNKVVEMLEGNLQSIQIPPKPILFTPSVPVREISWSSSAYIETEDSAEI